MSNNTPEANSPFSKIAENNILHENVQQKKISNDYAPDNFILKVKRLNMSIMNPEYYLYMKAFISKHSSAVFSDRRLNMLVFTINKKIKANHIKNREELIKFITEFEKKEYNPKRTQSRFKTF